MPLRLSNIKTSRIQKTTKRLGIDRAILLLIACTAFCSLFLILQNTEFFVQYIFPDDAFYYFKIAQNIFNGYGTTFDGINYTNGFHPLWALTLAPICYLMTIDKLLTLRLILIILSVLHIASLIVFYRLLRIWVESPAAIVGAVFYSLASFALQISFGGLETGLLAVFQLWALFYYLTRFWGSETPIISQHIILGFLLGLAMLSRLDSGFLIVVILLWQLFRSGSVLTRIKQSFMIGVTSAIVVAPYFWWNFSQFGHLLPISGTIKSRPFSTLFAPGGVTLSDCLFWPILRTLPKQITLVVAMFFVLFPPWLIMLRNWYIRINSSSRYLAKGLSAYVLFSLALYIYYSVFQSSFRAWYWLPQMVVASIMITWTVQALEKQLPSHGHKYFVSVSTITLIIMFLAFTFLFINVHFAPEKHRRRLEEFRIALWIQQNTQPDDIIAMWNAGVGGFFSDRQVINLDGLVNSYDYWAAVQNNSVVAYLKQQGVDYVADTFVGDPLLSGAMRREQNEWSGFLEEVVYQTSFDHKGITLFYSSANQPRTAYIWRTSLGK